MTSKSGNFSTIKSGQKSSSDNSWEDEEDPSNYLNQLKRHPHLTGTILHNEDSMKMTRSARMPIAGVDGCWVCDPDGCGNVNYPRRSSCHLCGRSRSAEGTKIVKEYVDQLCSEQEDAGKGGINYFESTILKAVNEKNVMRGSAASYKPSLKSTTAPAAPGTRAEIINMKFKTKLCKQWVDGGSCMRADQCDFAHGAVELRKIGDNAAGTGASCNDSLRLRFDLTAVANAVMEQKSYTSHTACVEPQYSNMHICVSVKVALYGHWAMEFSRTAVKLLEDGVSSQMSKASRNAVLETMGATVRIAGHPGRFTIVDLNGNVVSGYSIWHPLVTSLPRNTSSPSHPNEFNFTYSPASTTTPSFSSSPSIGESETNKTYLSTVSGYNPDASKYKYPGLSTAPAHQTITNNTSYYNAQHNYNPAGSGEGYYNAYTNNRREEVYHGKLYEEGVNTNAFPAPYLPSGNRGLAVVTERGGERGSMDRASVERAGADLEKRMDALGLNENPSLRRMRMETYSSSSSANLERDGNLRRLAATNRASNYNELTSPDSLSDILHLDSFDNNKQETSNGGLSLEFLDSPILNRADSNESDLAKFSSRAA